MNSKPLNDSNLQVPEIGLGTWAYSGGVGPIRKAIELGACLIDTAESYGTEEIVGQAIREVRHNVFLATKVSPLHFRRADLLQAADNSLRRLRTDYIDLYQLHWPNDCVPIEETMAALEELVEAGKVRFIGVSNFSVMDLKKAQAALRKQKIISNQVRYSLVERTIEGGLLAHCQREKITVMAFSPLGHGLCHIKARDRGGALSAVAATTGKTEAQVALNWCVSHEGVVAIPKSDSADRVAENCGASGWRLAPEDLRLLDCGINFRRRGAVESALRRLAQRALQKTGYQRVLR